MGGRKKNNFIHDDLSPLCGIYPRATFWGDSLSKQNGNILLLK